MCGNDDCALGCDWAWAVVEDAGIGEAARGSIRYRRGGVTLARVVKATSENKRAGWGRIAARNQARAWMRSLEANSGLHEHGLCVLQVCCLVRGRLFQRITNSAPASGLAFVHAKQREPQMHTDKQGCTQILAEPTLGHVQPDGRESAPPVCIAAYRCASVVHLAEARRRASGAAALSQISCGLR